MRLDLIFFMWYIYINSNLNPLPKFTSSSKGTKFKDILPWNISQMITKTIPISTRIVISYAMKWGILVPVLDLLKALAIISDKTVRRYVTDQEDLKPYWKSEKRPHYSR